MATRMQQRRGTAAQWISTNSGQGPVLNAGEIGFEIDNNRFKIGDGVNHWVDLPYFANNEAITDLIDGAPALLDTLNELAAAVGDDPAFFTTVATNLSNHQSDTTNIHGIADTSLLATTANVATAKSEAISAASSDATTKANAAQSTAISVAAADATSKANAAQAASEATASADATSKANAARTAAEATAASALTSAINTEVSNRNTAISTAVDNLVDGAPALLNTLNELAAAINDDANYTTTITTALVTKAPLDSPELTGVPTAPTAAADTNTTQIATTAFAKAEADAAQQAAAADATSKANAAQAAAISAAAADATAKATSVQAAAEATAAAALSAHDSDTTNVHGIANTSLLETQSGAQTKVDTHSSDTTGVHGIADTSLLETQTGAQTKADSAVSSHSSDTTNIHGIADTQALETQTGAQGKVDYHNSATTNVHGIEDTADLATQQYVLDQIANSTEDYPDLAGEGLDWNGVTLAFDIDSTVATKTYADTAVSTHSSDTTSVHGITDTAELATKAFAAELLTNATKTNVTITGDKNGLTITAENGVADSTTSDLAEGTNLYFTNERAQDAIGNSLGTGLTYTDSTGAISVTTNTYDSYGSASAVAGDLSTHTSDTTDVHGIANTANLATKQYAASLLLNATKTNITITGDVDGLTINAENGVADSDTDFLTEGTNNLYFTTERAQDAVGNSVGTGLSYNDATGAVSVDSTLVQSRVADVSDTEIGYLNGVTSSIQNQIDTKAALVSPTFTGTVSGITKTMVGLGNVDNTSDANKPVSTAQASAIATAKSEAIADATSQVTSVIDGAPAALNTLNELAAALGDDANFASTITSTLSTKAPIDAPTFTGTVSGITKSMVGLGNVDNTSDSSKPISSATQTALDAKLASSTAASTYAPIADPTFTGTVSGVTKSHVGLGNVDNTSDANKPVSTATQTALDLKAPLANPTFTGTVAGVTKTHVGLANVDNTSDANKPVSTATQTALNLKANLAGPTFTGTVTTDDLIVEGDLTVTGTTTTINATDLSITDPLIYLASNQYTEDLLDVGFLAATGAPGGTEASHLHSGFFRDASDSKKWKLVSNVPHPVGNVVDIANATRETLVVGALEATSATIGDVSNTELQYLNGVTSAIQTQLDNKSTASKTETLTNKTLTSPVINTPTGITKSDVGLGNVDNTTDAGKPVSTATQTALDLKANLAGPTFTGTVTLPTGTVTSAMILDGTIVDADISATAAIAQSKIDGLATSFGLKANLASPALTGTPTAPTAAAGTNTTQVATTAFVGTAVADLVASAPSALNTLNELATALGNDASFSTTVTNSLAAKAPLASPTFTGTATIPTLTLTNPLTAANGGTGLSSLGTGVATFLGTPSSANLAAMITDEIGTGNIVLSEIATSSQTASYTLVAGDRGKLVEMNVGSANTLTVPLDSTINFPVGTQIDILQVGSGQTTVAGAVGVTVNATPGLKIRAQWGGATLIKRAANTWVLIGDLTA